MSKLPNYIKYSIIGVDTILGILLGMCKYLFIVGCPTSSLSKIPGHISSVIGWCYFFYWSSSFYPQVDFDYFVGIIEL